MVKTILFSSLSLVISLQCYSYSKMPYRHPAAQHQVDSCQVISQLRDFVGTQLKEEEGRLTRINQALNKVGKEIKRNSDSKETNEKIAGLLAALGTAQAMAGADMSSIMSSFGESGQGLIDSWQQSLDVKKQKKIFNSLLGSYKISAEELRVNKLSWTALSATCNPDNMGATAELASKILSNRIIQHNNAIKSIEALIQQVPAEQVINYLKRPALLKNGFAAVVGGLMFIGGFSLYRAGSRLMSYIAMSLGGLLALPASYYAYQEVLDENKIAEEWSSQLATLKLDLQSKKASLEQITSYLKRLNGN